MVCRNFFRDISSLKKVCIFLVFGYQVKIKFSFKFIEDLEIFKSDDFSLDPVTMNTLSGKFNEFTVDCLAYSAFAICSKFYS